MALKRVRTVAAISLCLSFVMLIAACGKSAAPATSPAGSAPASAGTTTSADQPSEAGGQHLFENHCAVCHGQLGEGGKAPDGSIAPPLSAHLRAHAGLESGVQQIVRAVLDGVHEKNGETQVLGDAMPRFRGKLSEAEVIDIISYTETLH